MKFCHRVTKKGGCAVLKFYKKRFFLDGKDVDFVCVWKNHCMKKKERQKNKNCVIALNNRFC